jgi:hypothetical protein
MVRDDEKYLVRGLKGLGVDVKEVWSKVIQKCNTPVEGVKAIFKRVAETVEELVEALRT